MPQTDEVLVTRLKAGDLEAWGELYALYRPRIYRFARKLLNDSNQAEDTAQETFLKAQRGIQGLTQGLSVLSWLFTIARNEVYSHLRTSRRNGHVQVDDVWDTETPFDAVVNDEVTDVVQRMIVGLRPAYREVILLREYERLSYEEIARVIGDSEGAVKARIFKARKALVKKLKPYFGE